VFSKSADQAEKAGQDSNEPETISRARTQEPAGPPDAKSGAITVKLSKYQAPPESPRIDVDDDTKAVEEAKTSGPKGQSAGADHDSISLPVVAMAENEEDAAARGVHKAVRAEPVTSNSNTSDQRINPVPQDQDFAEALPPPLPKRKPRVAARAFDEPPEPAVTGRRRTYARYQYAPPPRGPYDDYRRPRNWPPVWEPGRWYRTGGQVCKVTPDGRLKCRKWRRVRDRILKRRVRRVRRAQRAYDPPPYWVRGRWYYYRGRLCKVKFNGEFVCRP
ncbi:MAG: hypothetical protein ACR2OX_04585, partial [Methyloligellaceae bacterium]